MPDMGDVNHKIKITADVDDAISGLNQFGGSLDMLSMKMQSLSGLANSEFDKIASAINKANAQISQGHQQQGSFTNESSVGSKEIVDVLKEISNLLRGQSGKPADPDPGRLPDNAPRHDHQAPPPHPGFTPGFNHGEHEETRSAIGELGTMLRGLLSSTGPAGYMASGMMGAAFSNPASAAITILSAAAAPTAMAVGTQFSEYDQRHTQETQYAQRVGFDPKLQEQGNYYRGFAEEGFKPLEANQLLEAARANAITIANLNEAIDSAKALGMDATQMVVLSGKASFDMGYQDMKQFGADMQAGAKDMGGLVSSQTPEFMQQQLAIANTFATAFGEKLEGEDRTAVHTTQKFLQDDSFYRDNLGAQERVLKGLAGGGQGVDPQANFGTFTYLRHAGVEAPDAIRGLSPEDKLKVMQFNEEELKRRFPDASEEQLDTARATLQKRMEGVLGLSSREQDTIRKQAEKHGWDRIESPEGEIEDIERGKQRHEDSRAGMNDRTQARLQDSARSTSDSLHSRWEDHLNFMSDSMYKTADQFQSLADVTKELLGPFGGLIDGIKNLTEKIDGFINKLTNNEALKDAGQRGMEGAGAQVGEIGRRTKEAAKEVGELFGGTPAEAAQLPPEPGMDLPSGEVPEAPSSPSQTPPRARQTPSTDHQTSAQPQQTPSWVGQSVPRRPQVPVAPNVPEPEADEDEGVSGSGTWEAPKAQPDWSGSGTVARSGVTHSQTFNPNLERKWSPRYKGILKSAAQKHGVPARILEKIKVQETGTKESNFRSGDGGMSHGGFQWYETVHPEVARRAKRDEQFGADKAAERLAWARRSVRADVEKQGWNVPDDQIEAMAATGHNAPAVADLESINSIRRRKGQKPASSWEDWWSTAETITAPGGHGTDTKNPFGGTKQSYLNNMYGAMREDTAGMTSTPQAPKQRTKPAPRVPAPKTSMVPLPKPTNAPITSTFGYRESPGGIGSTNHKGVDYGTPSGTPIYAPKDSTVFKSDAADVDGYGNYVGLDIGDGYKTGYAHLSQRKVKVGQKVKKGDLIGYTGGGENDPGRGGSTGAHLHYEVTKDGKFIDPLKAKIPAPVKAKPQEHHHDGDGHAHMDPVPRRQNVPMPRPSRPQRMGFMPDKDDDPLGGLFGPIGSNVPGYDQVVRGGLLPKDEEGVRTPDFNGNKDGMPGGLGGLATILLGGLGMAAMGSNPSTELEDKNTTNRAIRDTADNTREMRDYAREGRTPGINGRAELPGGRDKQLGALSGNDMLDRLGRQQRESNSALFGFLEKLGNGDFKGAMGEVGQRGKNVADDVTGGIQDKLGNLAGAGKRAGDMLSKIPGMEKAGEMLGGLSGNLGGLGTKIGQIGEKVAPGLGMLDFGTQLAHKAGMLPDSMSSLPKALGTGASILKKGFSDVFSGKAQSVNSIEDPEQKAATHGLLRSQAIGDMRGAQKYADQLSQIEKQRQVGDRQQPTVPGAPSSEPSPTWGIVSKGRSHNESEASSVPSMPQAGVPGRTTGPLPAPQAPKVQSVNGQVRGFQSGGAAGNKYVANVSNNINVGGQGGSGDPSETARLVAAVRNGTYAAMQEHERRFSREIDYN